MEIPVFSGPRTVSAKHFNAVLGAVCPVWFPCFPIYKVDRRPIGPHKPSIQSQLVQSDPPAVEGLAGLKIHFQVQRIKKNKTFDVTTDLSDDEFEFARRMNAD